MDKVKELEHTIADLQEKQAASGVAMEEFQRYKIDRIETIKKRLGVKWDDAYKALPLTALEQLLRDCSPKRRI